MITLSLKKSTSGYYSNQIDNIKIVVSSCKKGVWEGIVSDESKITDGYLLYNCFGETKQQIYNQIINFLIKN